MPLTPNEEKIIQIADREPLTVLTSEGRMFCHLTRSGWEIIKGPLADLDATALEDEDFHGA